MSLFLLILMSGLGEWWFIVSKKLMMNNYSENGMLPVMDGLICWLDGRDYVDGESLWKDRSGNKKNATLSDITGIKKNSSLYFKGFGNIENPTYDLNEYTIELNFKNLHTGYWCGLWGNFDGSGGNSVILNSKNKIGGYPYNVHNGWSTFTPTDEYTLTCVYKNNVIDFYVDTVWANKMENIQTSKADFLVICGRKPNNTTTTTTTSSDNRLNEWRSFKIYNRALTEEEIQHNYLYEQSIERGEQYVR